jgi:hypothetical protein
MITSSRLLTLGIKVIGLAAIAAIIFSVNVPVAIQSSYAQFLQPPQQQEEGEQQVESDGGLTATLNGDSFRRGDTITVSGTVGEREIDSYAVIEVIDPQSQTVVSAYPDVTADNTFTHSFIAGEAQGIFDSPMTVSGNYRMTVSYTLPGEGFETEEVEFVFEYDATSGAGAESEAAAGPMTTFQSIPDGFRIQVSNGWVVQDLNSDDPALQQYRSQYGAELLAFMCPQDQALPVIGGLYECTLESPDDVDVEAFRFVDLQTRPELAVLASQNRSVTTSDLVALYIEYLRETQPQEALEGLQIVNDTDTTVNVIDPQTNQTVGTAPAKYIELSHAHPFATGTFLREFALVVLGNDGNTGYVVHPVFWSGVELDAETPSFVGQALGSFELLPTTPSATTNTTATTTTPSPASVQPQQLVQSTGGLTARLNANNFTTGDTITVNGTVKERDPYAAVSIDLIDPQGNTVWLTEARVTADNTFTHSFFAGLIGQRMVKSGNYLMGIQYGIDRVEFTFSYHATASTTPSTTSSPASAPAEPTLPLQQEQRQPSPSPPTQQIQSSQQQERQQQKSGRFSLDSPWRF